MTQKEREAKIAEMKRAARCLRYHLKPAAHRNSDVVRALRTFDNMINEEIQNARQA